MPSGSGETEYRRAFETKVIPALERFAPSALLISAGFDAAAADDIANINLEPTSFAWMTAQLMAIADRHCGGRMISVLEGGYDLPSLARCVVEHVSTMMGDAG
jgi:acetoin utilization deacetylase AcuC-like enzyme